jgi:hypothetical protein
MSVLLICPTTKTTTTTTTTSSTEVVTDFIFSSNIFKILASLNEEIEEI